MEGEGGRGERPASDGHAGTPETAHPDLQGIVSHAVSKSRATLESAIDTRVNSALRSFKDQLTVRPPRSISYRLVH